jgi:hypothetical protein
MKLFGLFDFLEKDDRRNIKIFSPENIELQLLLISIYLLEKAPNHYTNAILKILETPETELVGNTNTFNMLDMGADDMKASINMNGYLTILKDDRKLYDENEYTLFNNMTEYLYKTALKSYFQDMNSDIPITSELELHPHLTQFFTGFTQCREFYEKEKYDDLKTSEHFSKKKTFKEKLSLVRKFDIYLSGFGITHDTIRSNLLPQIVVSNLKGDLFSIICKLDTGLVFSPNFMPDTTLEGIDPPEILSIMKSTFERIILKLFRILLNKGQNISKKFIASYNKKFFGLPYNELNPENYGNMTDEDYHNEFVKLLLKTWSGSPSIANKNYKIAFQGETSVNKLPDTHTCFVSLQIYKHYTEATKFYEDLVTLVTEGSNFGEAYFTGGKKKM